MATEIEQQQQELRLITSLAEHMKQSELLIRNHVNLSADLKFIREQLFNHTRQIYDRLSILEEKLGIVVQPPKIQEEIGIDPEKFIKKEDNEKAEPEVKDESSTTQSK